MTPQAEYRKFLSDYPESPSESQRLLMAEAMGKVDQLTRAGYKTVGQYIRHAQRDIDEGRRDAPSPPKLDVSPKRPKLASTGTSSLSTSDEIDRVDFTQGGATVARLNRLSDLTFDELFSMSKADLESLTG